MGIPISVPRARVAAGDAAIDRRGRRKDVPPILSYGFRPFFLGAALHAALAVPLWLWLRSAGDGAETVFPGPAWHAHEMIFGYLAAVMAGFILTAVPNWTGRLPLSGMPLAILFAAWLLGRAAAFLTAAPLLAAAADLVFPALLAASVWREIVAGRNYRNLPVAVLLTLIGLANLLHHLEFRLELGDGHAVRLALGTAAMLIALIGGRVTPSFTRNWLARQGPGPLPAQMGRLDRAALLATALAALAWIALPDMAVTGALMVAAGVLIALRLSRWQGHRAWREPIVIVLHLGYFWLAVSLLLIGLAVLLPAVVPAIAGMHALGAGAIGTMTLAVMTRATLGHTGRTIEADAATVAIYGLVTAAALIRVAATFVTVDYEVMLLAAGALWSGAFGLFALRYGPFLMAPRRTA